MDPSSLSSPPKLQMAQVLADLNSLKQAPPTTALSFLRTLSTISTTEHERKTSIHSQPAPKFDRLGRRISSVPGPSSVNRSSSSSPSPPPILRIHSSMSSDILPETEESKRATNEMRLTRRSSGRDSDFMRAKTLLMYYNNRDRLWENSNRGFNVSQKRVDKALGEQAQRRLKERERSYGQRFLGESDAVR